MEESGEKSDIKIKRRENWKIVGKNGGGARTKGFKKRQ